MIVAFLGGLASKILKLSSNGHHVIIRERCLDRYLTSESVLGPFPGGIDFISQLDPNTVAFIPAYYNHQTGETT